MGWSHTDSEKEDGLDGLTWRGLKALLRSGPKEVKKSIHAMLLWPKKVGEMRINIKIYLFL